MQKYYCYFYIALTFREKVFFESVALFERFKKLEKKTISLCTVRNILYFNGLRV